MFDMVQTASCKLIQEMIRTMAEGKEGRGLTRNMPGLVEFVTRVYKCSRIPPSRTACVCSSFPVTMLPKVLNAGSYKEGND